eukprot:TRINITY_DN8021_c0_g1_i3.p1 TRINITY_DN8021_c0_g1~~TRINITY_DN8021_c0_g1_i3.p1  ORF type:complete len:151 (+),score=26.79 TRINITY_DN8021_c0_g1_i3:269-721(+)
MKEVVGELDKQYQKEPPKQAPCAGPVRKDDVFTVPDDNPVVDLMRKRRTLGPVNKVRPRKRKISSSYNRYNGPVYPGKENVKLNKARADVTGPLAAGNDLRLPLPEVDSEISSSERLKMAFIMPFFKGNYTEVNIQRRDRISAASFIQTD